MIRTVMSLALALLIPLCGCARISVSKADGPVPNGVRIYAPQVLLMVDDKAEGGGQTSIMVIPNLAEAYDVRPVTFLAKNDFNIDLNDGMLDSLRSHQDTTAIITFFKGAAEMAAKATGVGVSEQVHTGTFGLPSGIYRLKPDWTLEPLPRPEPPKAES